MLLCCLQRKVEASCHTFRHRLPPSTNSAAYQRLVSSTRHPSQLSVLHLAVEAFTARDGARYWSENRDFANPTCIRRMTFGRGKLERFGYQMVKKIEDTRFDRMYERDRRTERRTDTA